MVNTVKQQERNLCAKDLTNLCSRRLCTNNFFSGLVRFGFDSAKQRRQNLWKTKRRGTWKLKNDTCMFHKVLFPQNAWWGDKLVCRSEMSCRADKVPPTEFVLSELNVMRFGETALPLGITPCEALTFSHEARASWREQKFLTPKIEMLLSTGGTRGSIPWRQRKGKWCVDFS